MTETSLAARAVGGPAGLVRMLTRLGPAFTRAGQLLALRPDLISPELLDELLREFAYTPQQLPWSAIRAFLSSELKDLDSLFRSIDPAPVFSNGLIRIHPAVTAVGECVLIKFLVPAVHKRVGTDVRRARTIARLMPADRVLIADLARQVERELDLTRELENIRKLAAASRNNAFLQVPKVYPELSTPSVLTTENLGGVPFSSFLSSGRLPAFKMAGFNANLLAVHLLDGAARQVLEGRFYCADVHPLNLLLLPGNRFSFRSFTHCEQVDAGNSLLYTHFLNGVFSTDLIQLARSFEELLFTTSSSRDEALREDFIRESHEWLRSAPAAQRIRRATDFSSPLSNWLVAILRAASRNRFTVSHEMISVFRTLVTVESNAMRLDPAVHLQSTGREVLKDIVLEDVFSRLEPVKIRSAVVNALSALNNAPEYLNLILSDAAQGRLGLNLTTSEHPHASATRDRRHQIVVTALVAIGVAWLMGEPGLPAPGSIPGSRLLAVVLAMLYLRLLLLWRRLA